MAEDIDIGNVGGQNGVASEATLARLTASIEAMAKKAGIDPKAEAAKLQKLYNAQLGTTIPLERASGESKKDNTKATKESTKATINYGKAIKGAALGAISGFAQSLTNMAGAVMGSETSLSSFAQHVPLIGNQLAFLTGLIDQNISSFRDLSQVGATFGNGLEDIRRIAAEASMPLGDFVSIVGTNSKQMQLFGAGTAAGAKNFALMSKNLRQVAGKDLMNLGFTSSDLNELLLDYAEFQDMQLGVTRRNTRMNTKDAAAFGEQLQLLAGATGKQRDEIMKAAQAAGEETRVRAAMAGMDKDQKKAFLLNIGAVPTEFSDVLKDMADGIPHSDAAQGMMAMSQTFRDQADQVKNMNPRQLNDFMAEVNNDIERSIEKFGPGAIESLTKGGDGIAEVLNSIAPSLADKAKMSDEEWKAMQAKLDAEKDSGTGLKQFGETINKLRGQLITALLPALEAFQGFASDKITALSAWLKSDDFKTYMDMFKVALQTGVDKMKLFFDNLGKYDLMTALFGGKKGDDIGGGNTLDKDVKGLFGGGDGEGFSISKLLGDTIKSAFSNWDIDWGKMFVGGMVGLGLAIVAPVIGIPAILLAAVTTVFGLSALEDLFKGAWNLLKSAFTFGADGLKSIGSGIGGLFTGSWNLLKGAFTFGADSLKSLGSGIGGLFTGSWDSIKDGFTFGADTLSLLTSGVSGLLKTVWSEVTGWFTFAEGTSFSISAVVTKMWDTVKSYFNFIDSVAGFSISGLAKTAWDTVTGWFGFGDGEAAFAISTLATKAWTTVKGWFGFGETTFSLSGLMTTAWTTVTGFFSFGDMKLPSITNLWTSIVDKVKGFFTFDFKMPNFKSFLPKWLGGEGKEMSGVTEASPASTNSQQVAEKKIPDPTKAETNLKKLATANSIVQSLVDIPNLKAIFKEVNTALNSGHVRSYATALRDVASQMEKINNLSTKTEGGLFGVGGTDVATAGATALNSGGITPGSQGSNTALNTSMTMMLTKLDAIIDNTKKGADNTAGISNDMATNLSTG